MDYSGSLAYGGESKGSGRLGSLLYAFVGLCDLFMQVNACKACVTQVILINLTMFFRFKKSDFFVLYRVFFTEYFISSQVITVYSLPRMIIKSVLRFIPTFQFNLVVRSGLSGQL